MSYSVFFGFYIPKKIIWSYTCIYLYKSVDIIDECMSVFMSRHDTMERAPRKWNVLLKPNIIKYSSASTFRKYEFIYIDLRAY